MKILDGLNIRDEKSNSELSYEEKVNKIKNLIEEADAIIIGAGAGMSTSAGFTYGGERFEKLFPEYIKNME